MPSGIRFVLYITLLLSLTGCVANDLVIKRQTEAEAKIEFMIQSSKIAEQRQNELSGLLQTQGERLETLNGEIKLLKGQNSELLASRDEFKVRLASLLQQQQTPKVEIVNQPSSQKALKESGPPADYLKAFGLYSANNFEAAIGSFEAFLKNNPQSDYAANAIYWIGECHYTLSDFPKAKEAFSKVAENYPKSTKAPDALLKLGYTFSALKEKDRADVIFERIITSYSSSPAATKARERLSAH